MLDTTLDEYTGDGIGDGLSDSSTGFSGDSLEDLDPVGSGLQLDYSSGYADFGTYDSPDAFGDLSLSGESDPAPSWDESLLSSDNGSGYAASTHVLAPSGTSELSSIFSAIGKFGASFGSMLTHQPAPAPYTLAPGGSTAANPNIKRTTGITNTHAIVLLVVLGGLILVISLGGE